MPMSLSQKACISTIDCSGMSSIGFDLQVVYVPAPVYIPQRKSSSRASSALQTTYILSTEVQNSSSSRYCKEMQLHLLIAIDCRALPQLGHTTLGSVCIPLI